MRPDQMTADQRALIRGMNLVRGVGYGGAVSRPSNIAALHFDGPELADLIAVHNEIKRVAEEGPRP